MARTIEVSCETDQEFAERGVCVVYQDGVEVSAHRTFNAAMLAAFPDYQAWDGRGHEAQADNWEA